MLIRFLMRFSFFIVFKKYLYSDQESSSSLRNCFDKKNKNTILSRFGLK